MNRVRTAVVGCGKVGHFHAQALSRLPESEFVAVCDAQEERAAAFAKLYNVQSYSDVATMMRTAEVQAVVIATPHPYHATPTLSAIRAGAHVLVEKPLASSLVDCDAMISAAKSAGVKLGVMSQRRWYPPVRRVKAAIDAGKLGRPVLGMVPHAGVARSGLLSIRSLARQMGHGRRRRARQSIAAPVGHPAVVHGPN